MDKAISRHGRPKDSKIDRSLQSSGSTDPPTRSTWSSGGFRHSISSASTMRRRLLRDLDHVPELDLPTALRLSRYGDLSRITLPASLDRADDRGGEAVQRVVELSGADLCAPERTASATWLLGETKGGPSTEPASATGRR